MATRAEEYRAQTIQFARRIISDNPTWSNRQINSALRSRHGRQLNHKTLDILAAVNRTALEVGSPRMPHSRRVTAAKWRKTLHDAGFLKIEILGRPDDVRPALGKILPDPSHPRYRVVLETMLVERYLMRDAYFHKYGRKSWSWQKKSAMWKRQVLRYYHSGKFPGDVQPVPKRGGFITADKEISPWALYNAYLSKVLDRDPAEGAGVEEYPQVVKGGVHKAFIRKPSKSKIRKNIAEHESNVRQLRASADRARAAGNAKEVVQRVKQIGYHNSQIARLKEQL